LIESGIARVVFSDEDWAMVSRLVSVEK